MRTGRFQYYLNLHILNSVPIQRAFPMNIIVLNQHNNSVTLEKPSFSVLGWDLVFCLFPGVNKGKAGVGAHSIQVSFFTYSDADIFSSTSQTVNPKLKKNNRSGWRSII